MARKPSKLPDNEGIVFHDDFCLRKEPLEHFVQNQPGYKDWRITKICNELKQYGALVIQEDGTNQVKVEDVRVYRIRVDLLKKCAEEY